MGDIMLKISDFTKKELNDVKEKSNFTAQEAKLFDLRNQEYCFEECAELMNISVSTVYRINKKMKSKIIRVI